MYPERVFLLSEGLMNMAAKMKSNSKHSDWKINGIANVVSIIKLLIIIVILGTLAFHFIDLPDSSSYFTDRTESPRGSIIF